MGHRARQPHSGVLSLRPHSTDPALSPLWFETSDMTSISLLAHSPTAKPATASRWSQPRLHAVPQCGQWGWVTNGAANGGCRAQSLAEVFESARTFDATFQSAKAASDATLAKSEQARAGLLPTVGPEQRLEPHQRGQRQPGCRPQFQLQKRDTCGQPAPVPPGQQVIV